jgi:ankyrin repeat-rich membrane spanning protein
LAGANDMTETVIALVEKGADVNAFDLSHMSAIEFASFHGRKEIVASLLQHGASPSKALSEAVAGARLDLVKWLLAQGADINYRGNQDRTPLFRAASRGNAEIVKLLLDHGAKVNLADRNGKTPLVIAAEKGHTNIVRLLESRRQPH